MKDFLVSLWNIIKRLFTDLWLLTTNVDELFFNYTTKSIVIMFAFLLSKYVPFGLKKIFKQAPLQVGGALAGLATTQIPVAQVPVAQVPVAPAPVAQVPIAPVAPVGLGKKLKTSFKQGYVPDPRYKTIKQHRLIKEKLKHSYPIMLLIIIIIYYVEHAEDCRTKSGGTIDKKSFIYNGIFTIGFTFLLYKIFDVLTNIISFLRIFKTILGDGPLGDMYKGLLLYFFYNFVRNFRNITERNTCEKSKETKEAEKKKEEEEKKKEEEKKEENKEEEKKESFENVFDVKNFIKKMKDKLKNKKVGKKDIKEMFEVIKKVNKTNPKELLKASNEIKQIKEKKIDSTTNIKKVKSQKKQELKKSLPLERRLPRGTEKNNMLDLAEINIKPKFKKTVEDTLEEKVFRNSKGRVVGLNF